MRCGFFGDVVSLVRIKVPWVLTSWLGREPDGEEQLGSEVEIQLDSSRQLGRRRFGFFVGERHGEHWGFGHAHDGCPLGGTVPLVRWQDWKEKLGSHVFLWKS